MRQHRAFSSTQTSNKSFEHGVLKPAARNPPRCTQSAATTDHNSSWGNGVSIAAAALVAFQCGLPLHSVAAAAAPIAPGDSPYAEAKRLVGFPYWAESVSVVCTVWSATAIEHRIDRVLFLFFIQAYGPTEDDRVRSCPTNINPNCVSTGGCVAHRAAATSQGHVLHWLRCVCICVCVCVCAGSTNDAYSPAWFAPQSTPSAAADDLERAVLASVEGSEVLQQVTLASGAEYRAFSAPRWGAVYAAVSTGQESRDEVGDGHTLHMLPFTISRRLSRWCNCFLPVPAAACCHPPTAACLARTCLSL